MRAMPGWADLGICWGATSLGVVLFIPSEGFSGPPPQGPPPGHPERLVLPTVPLNAEERALWSQLV